MVSVVPATAAGAVRTVAAAAWWPAAALVADGPPAAAAAAAPPAAATAARPIPAMMSLGCRIAGSLWGLDGRGSCALNYLRAGAWARLADAVRHASHCLSRPARTGAHPRARGRLSGDVHARSPPASTPTPSGRSPAWTSPPM